MITFVAADSSRYNVGGDAEQWNVEQLCDCPKDGQRHTHSCQLTGTCANNFPRLSCLLHTTGRGPTKAEASQSTLLASNLCLFSDRDTLDK